MPEGTKRPLVLVSNRGPVTFADDGTMSRGTGGLVTALTGLASYRDATWIASAMTDTNAAAPALMTPTAAAPRASSASTTSSGTGPQPGGGNVEVSMSTNPTKGV